MMTPNVGSSSSGTRPRTRMSGPQISPEHYLRLMMHRKWIILAIFVAVTSGVALYAWRLPNIYTSSAVILVDPQKVPESYVRSTVTGDVRNRLSTISNEILSGTQLQKIIESLNLYQEERKTMVREDIISKMRQAIGTTVMTDFAGNQDLQAFRIQFSGRDPRLVAEVANKLATAFIDENLTNRAQQATGTAEFIDSQLQQTKTLLEDQEAKIKDFNLKHIGQMPEQQTATIQAVSQLQAQLQMENDALAKAQERRKELVGMLAQTAPTVIDMDPPVEVKPAGSAPQGATARPQPADPLAADRAELTKLLSRYGANYPSVKQLKNKIAQEEAQAKTKAASNPVAVVVPPPSTPKAAPPADPTPAPAPVETAAPHFNPIVQSEIRLTDEEIARHKDGVQRATSQLAAFRGRMDSIPVTQQEIAALTRDYEITKARYSQLLDRRMNAETATQLEVRQKGEKFEVIDPALPAERPTSPNRKLYDLGGAVAGLALGLLAALATEFLGMSITDSQDVLEASGVNVLGVIPVILTQSDKKVRRRRWIMAAVSATAMALVAGMLLLLRMHNQA